MAIKNKFIIQGNNTDYGHKNYLINGDFSIWQRSNVVTTVGGFYADRWYSHITTTGLQAQSTDVPDTSTQYSMSLTTDSWANGIRQVIENGSILFAGKTITVSGWVKGPTGKTFGISLGWITEGALYTFTGSWQFVYRTVIIPSDFPTQAGNGGKPHLYVHIVRGIGGTTLASGDTVKVAKWQVELGSRPTQFEQRLYQTELALCQRYYWQAGQTVATQTIGVGQAYSSVNAIIMVTYPVTMRVTPVMTSTAASSFLLSTPAFGSTAVSNFSAYTPSPDNYSFNLTSATGLAAGNATFLLNNGAGTARIYFNAEI